MGSGILGSIMIIGIIIIIYLIAIATVYIHKRLPAASRSGRRRQYSVIMIRFATCVQRDRSHWWYYYTIVYCRTSTSLYVIDSALSKVIATTSSS